MKDFRFQNFPIIFKIQGPNLHNIKTSLFIDADKDQIDAAVECSAPIIEIHTGHYANSSDDEELNLELQRIIKASAKTPWISFIAKLNEK